MVVSYVSMVVHSFGCLLVLSCSCSPKTMATIYYTIISSSFISSMVILIVGLSVLVVSVPVSISPIINVFMGISNGMVTTWFFAISGPSQVSEFICIKIFIIMYCFVIIIIIAVIIVYILTVVPYDYSYLVSWSDTVNCNFEVLLRSLFIVAHTTVYVFVNLLLSYFLLKIFMMPKNVRTTEDNQNDEIHDREDEQRLMDSLNNSDHVV